MSKIKRAPAAPALSFAVQYGIDERQRLPRWRLRAWVQRALNAAAQDGLAVFQSAEISMRLVDQKEGRRLNNTFRHKDYATNVLTFEYGVDPSGAARGDIILCVPVLTKEARAQKKPFLHHAAHLSIHGALHALGYNHVNNRDAKRMETLETAILAQMGIEDPYTPST